jgi:hypothetical protein
VEDTEICPNGYGDSGGVLNVAEPIVTPEPEVDEEEVEVESSEELPESSASPMLTEVSDEVSAEVISEELDGATGVGSWEIKNDSQTSIINSTNTQKPIENKLADLQLETSTMAQAVAQNSDRILHEAVIATVAVMFLLSLVIFGACRLKMCCGSTSTSNFSNFVGKRTVSRDMRSGSLTIGNLMGSLSSNLNRLSSKEGYIQLDDLSEETDSENGMDNVIFESTLK